MMRKKIDAGTRGALIVLMGALVVCVVWQVFSRYILNAPSTFTDELARFLLIWVSLLGVAYLSGQNRHISINILPQKLNDAGRLKLGILINSLIILFVFSVLIVGGGILIYTTFTHMQLTPTLQIPMAFVYLIGPICGLLVLYYKIFDIKEILASGGGKVAAETPPPG
ncbi:MAG: TRAP transporter small permease [Balneolaceae bacterium]